MKIKSSFFSLMALMVAIISMSSCNESKNPPIIPDGVLYDFATLASNNDNGSTFTLRKDGDSPLVTLSSTQQVPADVVKTGSRLIIQYMPSGGQKAYESGPINLYGVVPIENGGIEEETLAAIESVTVSLIKMRSIFRTGEYVNIWLEGYLETKPTTFKIVVDEATVDNSYPEAYLLFVSDRDMGRQRQVYASFNISEVWNRSTCKGLRINYRTSLGTEFVKFDKSGHESINPGEVVE